MYPWKHFLMPPKWHLDQWTEMTNKWETTPKSVLMFSLPCICLASKVSPFQTKRTSQHGWQIDNSCNCKTRIQKPLLLLETTEVNDAKWIMIFCGWLPPQYFTVSDDLLNIKGVVESIFHWRTMQCYWHTQAGNVLTKHQKNCRTVWMAAE